MDHRLLPPTTISKQTMTVNGRVYSATPGSAIDVPDFDSTILQANGWQFVAPSGPSSDRPASALGLYPRVAGAKFYDTTLGAMIEYDGQSWRRVDTGAAA
jgi:hypothetical protein